MKIPTALITVTFLIAACTHAPKDHITSYDFSSARLVDLPWEMGAAVIGSRTSFEFQDYIKEHHPDWNYVQYKLGWWLFADHTDADYVVDDPADIIPKYDSVDSEQCRLKDGQLWNELCVSNGIVTLKPDRYYLPYLEIEVLSYDDYDHDGFMDVRVIRRLPGSAAPWEELVLSRRSENEPLYVLEHRDRGFRGMEREL